MILVIVVIIIIIIILIAISLIYFTMKNKNNESKTSSYAQITDAYINPQIISNVLTADEISFIINYAKNKLVDSEIVSGKDPKFRNSQQCWIPKDKVKTIYDKISQIVKIPSEYAEDLQVVRYLPSQYFREHHDSCCDDNDHCKNFLLRGGHRVRTVLLYLNNDFTDGETSFPNLNLKLKPTPGSAILFYPLASNSYQCHPKALHAGLPVTSGEKWVANIWYRQNKFQ
jgi:prolyl 4-hydroxylase